MFKFIISCTMPCKNTVLFQTYITSFFRSSSLYTIIIHVGMTYSFGRTERFRARKRKQETMKEDPNIGYRRHHYNSILFHRAIVLSIDVRRMSFLVVLNQKKIATTKTRGETERQRENIG